LYKPDLVTRIGLGYRSAISEQISGFGQQYIVHGNTTTPPPAIPSLFNAQTAVHAGIKTPAALTLSAARDINNWTLKASAQLNFWSTFDHLSIYMPSAFVTNSTIQTKWSNAWFAALGADYRFSSPWIVRGGLAYDQTPTTGYRDPRIPDTDRFWATIGASYLFNKQLSLDGVYEHIFMVNQKVNVTQTSGTTPFFPAPLETNTVHAKYQASVNIVGLALRYNF
jgi:long-chain fatty acid transport protein